MGRGAGGAGVLVVAGAVDVEGGFVVEGLVVVGADGRVKVCAPASAGAVVVGAGVVAGAVVVAVVDGMRTAAGALCVVEGSGPVVTVDGAAPVVDGVVRVVVAAESATAAGRPPVVVAGRAGDGAGAGSTRTLGAATGAAARVATCTEIPAPQVS